MSNLMFFSLIGFAVLAWLAFLIFGVPWFTGREFKRNGYKPRVIPETADEAFVFAGRPNYSGLRDSVMRAEEAAGRQ